MQNYLDKALPIRRHAGKNVPPDTLSQSVLSTLYRQYAENAMKHVDTGLEKLFSASAVECYINCYLGVHFPPKLAWPLLDFCLGNEHFLGIWDLSKELQRVLSPRAKGQTWMWLL